MSMNRGLFRSKCGWINYWIISSLRNGFTGENPSQPEGPDETDEPEDEPNLDWWERWEEEETDEPEDEPNLDWWDQCDDEDCYANNWKPYMENRIYLCEFCDKCLKLPSSDRIVLLVEPSTWDPTDQNMVSLDPVEWDAEEPITFSKDGKLVTLSDEEATTPYPSAKDPDYWISKYLEHVRKCWKYFQHMLDVLERENEKTRPKLLAHSLGDFLIFWI